MGKTNRERGAKSHVCVCVCWAREEPARLLIQRMSGRLVRDGAGGSCCSRAAELAPGWLWDGLSHRLNALQISLHTAGCYQCSSGARSHNICSSTHTWPTCVSTSRHKTKQRHRKHKHPLQNANYVLSEAKDGSGMVPEVDRKCHCRLGSSFFFNVNNLLLIFNPLSSPD